MGNAGGVKGRVLQALGCLCVTAHVAGARREVGVGRGETLIANLRRFNFILRATGC